MQFTTEWTSGVGRILAGPYGTKYVWSCHVVRVDDTIYLMGVTEIPPDINVPELVGSYCRDNGIKYVVWDRYKDGVPRRVTIDVEKYWERRKEAP